MKRLIFILCAVLLAGIPVFAQESAVVVLEYSTDLAEIQVLDRDGFEVETFYGIGLSPGDRIITGSSAAELRLEPNGSIIRLAPGTTFVIDALQGQHGARDNSGTLFNGRARFLAARSAERNYKYTLRTTALVAGVRGTDFAFSEEELFVFEGEVIVTSVARDEAVFLTGGQGVSALDEPFLPQQWGADRIQEFEGDLTFEYLSPFSVPGLEQEEPPAPVVEERPAPTPPPVVVSDPEPGFGDRMFGTLAGITGMQIGAVTINEQTWGQVVFLPQLRLGDLSIVFYMPVTYATNLFDPQDWYRPEGNNEWSFGSDQNWTGDTQGALRDLATDLALKIHSIHYRDQGDPLFLKMGNLNTFTIGQGLLMRNYANDTGFPAVRRLGFNTGVDLTAWGLEAFVNDLIDPNIYGGRLFFRPAVPVYSATVGFSAVVDTAPGQAITVEAAEEDDLLRAAREADPMFINVAADLDLPLFQSRTLAITGFMAAGAYIPYIRETTEFDGRPVSSGTKTNALVDFQSGNLRNYGWTAGFRGDLFVFDFRLAYQYSDSTFRPGFYGPAYDRLRGTYAADTIKYLSNTEATEYKGSHMGIEGELGATLFGFLNLGVGYLWPWDVTPSGSWESSPEDEVHAYATLREGVIPLGIGVGIEYRRRYFAPALGNWNGYSTSDLFDANTTLTGHISYPVTDFIRLVARLSTAAQRDSNGEFIYDSDGRPRMNNTVSIQTEIGLK